MLFGRELPKKCENTIRISGITLKVDGGLRGHKHMKSRWRGGGGGGGRLIIIRCFQMDGKGREGKGRAGSMS